MKNTLFTLCFCLFALTHAEDIVTFAQAGPARALSGNRVEVSFNIDVKPGWHIYAHKLATDFLIPTVLQIQGKGVSIDSVAYPAGVEKSLMGITDRLYEGRTVITVSFASSGEKPSSLTALLKFQGCDDKQCLPPAEKKVDIVLPESQPVQEGGIADRLSRYGLVAALFFLFAAGLALNLTPCVYPVIPITLGFFSSQAGASRGKLLVLSSAYVGGIALMYSTLGTLAALSGSFLGAWLGHPVVLFSIAALFVALALSMFGLYELRPPAFLMSLGVGRRGGLGAFVMGMVVGVVAAPCVGPVTAGLLVYVAQQGSPVLGFAYFFALSLGLGAPYFALGMLSGSLHRLPRSGGWMVWVKRVFGVVLLAMAFYYIRPLLPHASAPAGHAGLSVVELARAATLGKPYVADFRADWCAPCRQFEREVLADPEVKSALAGAGFYTVDLTRSEDAEAKKTVQAYRVTGVPTIIFFSRKGEETFRFTGAPDKQEFLSKLNDILRE